MEQWLVVGAKVKITNPDMMTLERIPNAKGTIVTIARMWSHTELFTTEEHDILLFHPSEVKPTSYSPSHICNKKYTNYENNLRRKRG